MTPTPPILPTTQPTTPSDATAIVSEWLSHHPELAETLRQRDRASFRAAVTVYLVPYDRFPSTLGKLLTVALDGVDWGAIFNHGEET